MIEHDDEPEMLHVDGTAIVQAVHDRVRVAECRVIAFVFAAAGTVICTLSTQRWTWWVVAVLYALAIFNLWLSERPGDGQ